MVTEKNKNSYCHAGLDPASRQKNKISFSIKMTGNGMEKPSATWEKNGNSPNKPETPVATTLEKTSSSDMRCLTGYDESCEHNIWKDDNSLLKLPLNKDTMGGSVQPEPFIPKRDIKNYEEQKKGFFSVQNDSPDTLS